MFLCLYVIKCGDFEICLQRLGVGERVEGGGGGVVERFRDMLLKKDGLNSRNVNIRSKHRSKFRSDMEDRVSSNKDWL